MDEQQLNAEEYEAQYRAESYLPVYPEGQIVRAHRHVLEWELGIGDGTMFDFGCGGANNARYFADQGFVPFGCDSSAAAIDHARRLLPEFADNFFVVSATEPQLLDRVAPGEVDVFVSNQVLYYLDDAGIHWVAEQAAEMLRPGGAFVVSMMAPTCWYSRFATGEQGDFTRIEMQTARLKGTFFINFKERDELPDLFQPFRKLHIGFYNLGQIREDEGPTDHWLYIGVKE